MYTLTLSPAERRAIDFVGNRYWHGWDFESLLTNECRMENTDLPSEDCGLWDDCQDIIFHVPEHVAWEIRENLESDSLALFSDEFASKLILWAAEIV